MLRTIIALGAFAMLVAAPAQAQSRDSFVINGAYDVGAMVGDPQNGPAGVETRGTWTMSWGDVTTTGEDVCFEIERSDRIVGTFVGVCDATDSDGDVFSYEFACEPAAADGSAFECVSTGVGRSGKYAGARMTFGWHADGATWSGGGSILVP